MPRNKDEEKRSLIMNTSKRLIAKKGFHNTSISDIVDATGLPVGTIYTYFKNKEDIIETIVENGWNEFYSGLKNILRNHSEPTVRLRLVIDEVIPQLIKDVDLINILLTEGVTFTGLEDKIDKITDIIHSTIHEIMKRNKRENPVTRSYMRTAIIVFFLGILNSVKLLQSKRIGLKYENIISFLKITVSQSLGVDIWKNTE